MAERITMSSRKRIAVVAHDNKKEELIACLKQHRAVLAQHELFGTGTTGSLVEERLGLPVTKLQSGPLGGDQQLGSLIVSHLIDILFFLIDPLDAHPHLVDVHALLRVSQVWNIVNATTTSTIDFILRSSAMNESHSRQVRHLTRPKAKIPVRGRSVAVTGVQRSKVHLPHLSPERKQPVLQQSIFKKC